MGSGGRRDGELHPKQHSSSRTKCKGLSRCPRWQPQMRLLRCFSFSFSISCNGAVSTPAWSKLSAPLCQSWPWAQTAECPGLGGQGCSTCWCTHNPGQVGFASRDSTGPSLAKDLFLVWRYPVSLRALSFLPALPVLVSGQACHPWLCHPWLCHPCLMSCCWFSCWMRAHLQLPSKGNADPRAKTTLLCIQVHVFFSCCLLRGSLWFGWNTWHCKHGETAAELHQPEKTEPHPHSHTWRHSAFFCFLKRAEILFFQICFCVYIPAPIHCFGATSWGFFSRNSDTEKNKHSRVCAFLFTPAWVMTERRKEGR